MNAPHAPPSNVDADMPIVPRLALWTFLCSVSAAPSFLWAIPDFDAVAMVCGVGVFIGVYTSVTGTNTIGRFKSRPFVRRTIYVGYITRVCVSVAFPLGMGIDFYPGLLSTQIVHSILVDSDGFLGTFTTTLIQGTFINIILAAYMGLIYIIQLIFVSPPVTEGICLRCGYDLRASPIRCPECGEPAPKPGSPNQPGVPATRV